MSNLQAQALLNQLVPCSDNAIIADEDKRDLQLLSCLAQPPLQLVRHIRVDVQNGNQCLAKTSLPFHDQFREFAFFHFSHGTYQESSSDISGEETHASHLTRARDEDCPLRHFVASDAGSSPPAIRGTGKADPAGRSMRQISLQAKRRLHNSTPHPQALLVPAQVALAQHAPSHGSRLASTQTCVPISRDSQLRAGTRPTFRR